MNNFNSAIVKAALLLFPSFAHARGGSLNLDALLYIALAYAIVMVMKHIFIGFFLMPIFIVRFFDKNLSDEEETLLSGIYWNTLFIPFIFTLVFGSRKGEYAFTAFSLILWLLICYVVLFHIKPSSRHKDDSDLPMLKENSLSTEQPKPITAQENHFYQWELTKYGIINIATGQLIPSSYLKVIDDEVDGVFIDNYLGQNEFIDAGKIKNFY